MKKQHLPLYYQYKQVVVKASAKFFGKLPFFLPLILLAACNSAPNDDGTAPASLYTPPQSWEANPKGGYKVNKVTGRPVKPILTADGKPIITGIPIPAIGKRINPDSMAKPKSEKITPIRSEIKTMDNVYPVPENLQQIRVDESKLIQHNVTNSPQGYVIKKQFGGTTPTGKPIAAKGKTVPVLFTTIRPALPLRINDNALYDLQYLNMDQGLNNVFIVSQFEDKDGYLWFGTIGGGVSRYDGKSFVVYGAENGLLGLVVNSIMQDRKGHLWFGMRGGVSRFDGKTFVNFTSAQGLPSNIVSKIIEDKTGNLWFATRAGVSKFEPSKDDSTGTFINYTSNEGLSNNNVSSVAEDKAGNLWFATQGGGVNKFDGKSFIHFTTKEGLANDTVTSIMQDKAGHLWFGTMRGASKFDGKTFVPFSIQFSTSNGVSDNQISDIKEDRSGNIWFGTTTSGVIRFDGKTFVHITEDQGLSSNNISSVMEDRSGHLWFSTNGGGLTRFNTTSFQRFTKAVGLSSNFLSSAMQDRSGQFWFGSNIGINKYDANLAALMKHSGQQNQTALKNSFFSFPASPTTYSLEDKFGNLWFSSVGEGVRKFDGQSFTQFTQKEGLVSNGVRIMLEDSRGHLWFGGVGVGLTRYEPVADGKSGTFTHFTEAEGFIRPGLIHGMLEDKSGNLWFCHSFGVSKYMPTKDGQSGSFVHFTAAEGLGINVNSILEDKKGNLWFGAFDGGLTRFVPSKQGHSGTFTHFTKAQGLVSNVVRSLLEDKSGNLLIGTAGGLSKYDGKTFLNFTTTEGLSGNNVDVMMKDKDGNLWIPTFGGGVSKMEKGSYQPSQQPPVVSLRQLYINEAVPDYLNPADSTIKDVKFDSVQAYENYPINAKIPSDQNHLSFKYSAIDWNAPTKIKYSFRLLGLDNKWSNPAAETLADYRNLPDGKFTFQVRAIGESGEWSKAFEYSFTILPPWWKTWWAYTIYALLFLAALRTFSLWRERRLRKEKDQLQHKVEERTGELKKSLQDLKSTQNQLIQSEKLASLGELTAGIAHEIQNPLNFVNNFSEVSVDLAKELDEEIDKDIIDKGLAKELMSDLILNQEKINLHGKRASSIVKGMLEHSRTSTGVKELTDINKLADEYLRLSYHGLRAKDNTFNSDFELLADENLPKIEVIPQDMGRVLLNLINNAFWAVKTVEKPLVAVKTEQSNNQIIIKVKDNGTGMSEATKAKIFQPFFTTKPTGQGTGLGLSLAYDIVTKGHSGTIEVESVEGEGSTFVVKLPIC